MLKTSNKSCLLLQKKLKLLTLCKIVQTFALKQAESKQEKLFLLWFQKAQNMKSM